MSSGTLAPLVLAALVIPYPCMMAVYARSIARTQPRIGVIFLCMAAFVIRERPQAPSQFAPARLHTQAAFVRCGGRTALNFHNDYKVLRTGGHFTVEVYLLFILVH